MMALQEMAVLKFFAKICCKFLAFLSFLAEKNAENDYFDQPLECAAPKRWSKYTTLNYLLTQLYQRFSVLYDGS